MREIKEKEEIRREEVEPDLWAVYTGSQALAKAPELYGVATGIEGLDDLFFIVKQVGKKLEKVVSKTSIPNKNAGGSVARDKACNFYA